MKPTEAILNLKINTLAPPLWTAWIDAALLNVTRTAWRESGIKRLKSKKTKGEFRDAESQWRLGNGESRPKPKHWSVTLKIKKKKIIKKKSLYHLIFRALDLDMLRSLATLCNQKWLPKGWQEDLSSLNPSAGLLGLILHYFLQHILDKQRRKNREERACVPVKVVTSSQACRQWQLTGAQQSRRYNHSQ